MVLEAPENNSRKRLDNGSRSCDTGCMMTTTPTTAPATYTVTHACEFGPRRASARGVTFARAQEIAADLSECGEKDLRIEGPDGPVQIAWLDEANAWTARGMR